VFKFLGLTENLAVFSGDKVYAVVDTAKNLVQDMSQVEIQALIASASLATNNVVVSDSVVELAKAALVVPESTITASGDRMYTIPAGVQDEAVRGLEWRKEEKRGGTPVGLNTARTLADGGQIGIKKIRHIAKYFPRHEVDKKGKGWAPGEDNFPSNGRIAWALWGGDAAWRWARAIVERENKKALTSTGYALPGYEDDIETYGYGTGYDADLNPFKIAHELDLNVGPEFMARVRLDGSGIDRLYKIEIDGRVYIWDDCGWDDLGHVDGDVYTYDKALDDPYDLTETDHVIIDPSAAVIISAFFQERPNQPVLLIEIDPEETMLMSDGLYEEDFDMVDRVMTAAGEPVTNQDGNYTPDERSDKAAKQVRDASGKFAKAGSRVVVAGDENRGSGVIESVDSSTGLVSVKLDSGSTIEVDAKYTRAEEAPTTGPRRVPTIQAPLDMSGVLGVPRTSGTSKKAQLPGTLPVMTNADIALMISDWPAYVAKQRAAYKLHSDTDPGIKTVTKGKQSTAPGLSEYDKKYMKKNYDLDMSAEGITASAEESDEINSPKESDVPAKYLALVSPDDSTAVMDLVAIVPETKTTTAPALYRREAGKWIKDDQILMDLKSATPPDVVELDDQAILNDVLVQTDSAIQASGYLDFSIFWETTVEPILAAGGLDRNRENAEELRKYWTRGKGALKIRWGTPGDWTRCVRNLSKYMGARAKGYCQLRHKEATGVYTGSKLNPGKKSQSFSTLFQTEADFDKVITQRAVLAARAADAREKVGLVAGAVKPTEGAKFHIPMIVPEEMESGDGRKFSKDAITTRELPLPLLWQIKTGAGHDGSVVVGRIDYIERIEGGMGNAYGVFDTGPYGREAERLVKHGFLRGVSVDLDQFEAKEDKRPTDEASEDDGHIGKDKLTINKARIMAATIVAKPAFQECSIYLQNSGDQEEEMTPEDGVYEESLEDFSDVEPITASGYLASEIPVAPPAEWFENPGLTKATPLTVDKDGRVYGHIAAWHVSHIGLPRSTKPPRSRSKYAYFHTGVIHTAVGTDVPVGQLTLAGGHAPLNADAASAAKHYDDTASAVADVHMGEDEYGIWCAGSLRPGVDEYQVRALRASAPSGDWRPINGSLELVAVCQVNVPGFPVARAMIASGKVLALVAAGANYMAMMKSNVVSSLVAKADLLGQLSSSAPDLKSRVKTAERKLREANIEALTASAAEMREKALTAAAIAELAKISEEERMDLAKDGKAMPDGAYPIRDTEDLKNAIQAYGRAKASERAAVRKHIIKQARKLKQSSLIPQHWVNADSMEAAQRVASMRAAITAAAVRGENPCWDGYEMIGMKEQDGKSVPNCVPIDAASASEEVVVSAAPKVRRSPTQS
jgi:hypothetical protein